MKFIYQILSVSQPNKVLNRLYSIIMYQIYNVTFKILNFTLGRFIRFFQQMSLSRRKIDINDLLYEKALDDTASLVYTQMQAANFFIKREQLWNYCVLQSNLNATNTENKIKNNFFAEFGTWKGDSINYFANLLQHIQLHGFDSFLGLNEDWSGTLIKKGHFNLNGSLPSVNNNVILHPGFFCDTVPKFVRSCGKKQAGILHIDSDTFEAASVVLKIMKPTIKNGTIIIFDEFFGYPNWRAHEFKAWSEFSVQHKINYKYIAYTQVAVALVIC